MPQPKAHADLPLPTKLVIGPFTSLLVQGIADAKFEEDFRRFAVEQLQPIVAGQAFLGGRVRSEFDRDDLEPERQALAKRFAIELSFQCLRGPTCVSGTVQHDRETGRFSAVIHPLAILPPSDYLALLKERAFVAKFAADWRAGVRLQACPRCRNPRFTVLADSDFGDTGVVTVECSPFDPRNPKGTFSKKICGMSFTFPKTEPQPA